MNTGIVHPAVKVSEMEFVTQIVPGNKFKLTLSNATKQIRFKIPDSASAADTVRVSDFVKDFVESNKDHLVSNTLRSDFKFYDDVIWVVLKPKSKDEESILKFVK
jgi:hypothetical protein